MPLDKEANTLVTKVRQCGNKVSQQILQRIHNGADQITSIFFHKNQVCLQTGVLLLPVPVGVVKDEYVPFLKSLKNPVVSYEVTGGGYKLIDHTGDEVRDVTDKGDLSPTETKYVLQSGWKLQPRFFGLNIEVTEQAPELAEVS